MIHNQNIFKIFTHMTESERLLLFDLAKRLPNPAVVVEIGSYLGASTCFLAEGLIESGKEGRLYAVDTWTNIAMSEGGRETYTEFSNNIQPYEHIITPLRGLSVEVSKDFFYEIDLLFIDGDHSYQGAYSDLKHWLPKVKDNGWVICHDYGWAEGVRRAVCECLIPYQTYPGWHTDNIYWTQISHQRFTAASNFKSTVAIPTYRRREYVLDAIRSVMEQKTDFDFEILVLDNGCDDDLGKEVKAIAQNTPVPIRYIPVVEKGLHQGRNLGAMKALGEIIVYIDDDVIAPQGWLASLCKPFEDFTVGGVGGKVLPKWEMPSPDWTKLLPLSYFSLLDLGDVLREMNATEAPYGCNMAFRRALIFSLDGFPPDGIGNGWIEWRRGDGETGFAQKMRQGNYKLIYSPEAWLYHRIPQSRQTLSFVRRRTIKGAISGCFSQLRSSPISRLALIIQGTGHLLRTIKPLLKRIKLSHSSPDKWLEHEIQWIYYAFSGFYKLRLSIDRELRKWVYRKNFWPEHSSDSTNLKS